MYISKPFLVVFARKWRFFKVIYINLYVLYIKKQLKFIKNVL